MTRSNRGPESDNDLVLDRLIDRPARYPRALAPNSRVHVTDITSHLSEMVGRPVTLADVFGAIRRDPHAIQSLDLNTHSIAADDLPRLVAAIEAGDGGQP